MVVTMTFNVVNRICFDSFDECRPSILIESEQILSCYPRTLTSDEYAHAGRHRCVSKKLQSKFDFE